MRRKAVACAIAPLVLLMSAAPAGAVTGTPEDIDDLTLIASTDTHGTALNYDYFTGRPFGTAEDPKNLRGMEHLSTAISDVRAEEGEGSVILVDNGDANQGSSLETVYHANRTPSTTDPIASLNNYLDYDAGTVGNHEFNYGLADLNQYRSSLDFPLLGANVIDRATGQPYFEPYTMVNKTTEDGHEVQVAIIGVVTPGVPAWDGEKVSSLQFTDMVEAVKKYVPIVRGEGADVVIVTAHTGQDPAVYSWKASDLQENAARSIAETVSGVDVVVGGHSHVTDQVETYYTNPDGREVLYTQPGYHGRFLSRVTIPLSLANGEPVVDWTQEEKPSAIALKAADYPADPRVKEIVEPWHSRTQAWVATKVATASEDMPAATAAWEDTPILDFINRVQTDELRRGLEGTEYEGLPIVSEVSPFSRTAVFDKGDVTIADMASLYVYDNTLYGVQMTGAELKDYLEYSARYYKQQDSGAEVADWSAVTNAQYDGMTRGIPDYSYDVLSGVDYHVDISKPVGERIENLTWPDGTPIQDDDVFAFAVNNYRKSGGSGYPAVKDAPVIYDEQTSIRELMIQWAQEHGTINPADFFDRNWTVGTSPADKPQPQPSEPTPPSAIPEGTPSDNPSGERGSSGTPAPAPTDNQGSTGGQLPQPADPTSTDKPAPVDAAEADADDQAADEPAEDPADAPEQPAPSASEVPNAGPTQTYAEGPTSVGTNKTEPPVNRPGGFLPTTGAEITATVAVALALISAGAAFASRYRTRKHH